MNINGELYEAVANGDLEKCRELIGTGADVNARDKDDATALIIALEKGEKDIVRHR